MQIIRLNEKRKFKRNCRLKWHLGQDRLSIFCRLECAKKTRARDDRWESPSRRLSQMASALPISKGSSQQPLTPSQYIQDRRLTCGQKLAQVSSRVDSPLIISLSQDKEGSVRNYQVPIDRPLFQPCPSVIAFQSFEPFVTYEVVVNFRNIDKVQLNLQKSHYKKVYSTS